MWILSSGVITTKHYLGRAALAAALALSFTSGCSQPSSGQQPVAAQASRAPTAAQLGRQMVDALRANPGGLGQLPALATAGSLVGEEKAAYEEASRAFNIVLETTGERLSGQNRLWLAVDIDGWFLSRQPITYEKVAMYLSRYEKVDLATVTRWRELQALSGEVGNSPSLTLSAIVFQDFLWDGGDWRRGNPDGAFRRLGSLTRDAVSRWDQVAKANGSDVYGAWTLLAVDALFVDDAFQADRFEAALPEAERLLSANPEP